MSSTRGTNPEALATTTDSQLRSHVIDAALDIARAANRPGVEDWEILFTINTVNLVGREVRNRVVDRRALAAAEHAAASDAIAPTQVLWTDRAASDGDDMILS